MRNRACIVGLLAAMAIVLPALGFDAYFSDAAGNKIGLVSEGRYVYVAVRDPEKGVCGIAEFQADLVIFDFKTGAYIWVEDDPNTPAYEGAWFRESVAGSGLFFWVTGPGSSSKVGIQVGSRSDFTNVPYGQTHVLGNVSPAPLVPVTLRGFPAGRWEQGAWEYADEDVLGNNAGIATTTLSALPQNRLAARVSFEGLPAGTRVEPHYIHGRLENNDTLVLIVADRTDKRNINQHQIKLKDTVSKITVTPTKLIYGCPGVCNIQVKIVDMDENLNSSEVEYVPFFVIVNPGGWNPADSRINNFCALMVRGGFDPAAGADILQPIRWYNIYDEPSTGVGTLAGVTSRFIQYPADWLAAGNTVGRALFFAVETGPDTGEFEYNFGTLDDLQRALGFATFPMGTTIAFYYIDPNDFDDMDLAVARVGNETYAEVYFTNAAGFPVTEVKLGAGHEGLYVRVYDGNANVDACCQDKVVVHICDPHNEDDSEYWIFDEVSNDSGVFASRVGMPLLPVWDAVGGYQLVFDNWKLEAFNEDTIFVRYNSVDYVQADMGRLGDGGPNDGFFPPRVNEAAVRNQPWNVAFAKVKVYDYQVFDGTTHRMRFLDGDYRPVTEIPIDMNLYLEVTDLDQNENPNMVELIRSAWNRDASAADDGGRDHGPRYNGAFGLPDPQTLTPDAGEDSAPIWWLSRAVPVPPPPEQPPPPPEQPPPPPEGDSDIMTPAGLVRDTGATPYVDPYLGGPQWPLRGSDDVSITGLPETVKILVWNAQNGNWEMLDLKETGPNTGIFRSTTCVELTVAAGRGIPGYGNLGAAVGDTIMAFYQDPSNHSDVSIISIKVVPAPVIPVVPKLEVEFDKPQYQPGDTLTITVTDEAFRGLPAIEGPAVLTLKLDGVVLKTWDSLPLVSGETMKFRVTHTLDPALEPGTLTATYTQPIPDGKTKSATATLLPGVLEVTGIKVEPNPFKTTTKFERIGRGVAVTFEVTVYDLLGRQVGYIRGDNVASVIWNGGKLGNGAYIYVAVLKDQLGKLYTFRGFVYIKR